MNKVIKEHKWILEYKYKGVPSKEYENDIKRFSSGEPIDYIIGNMSFLGCDIDLKGHPLIPRAETEYWTEKAIRHIQHEKGVSGLLNFMDIFSGSGCIGLSLLKHFTQASVTFVDNDMLCIKQIKRNVVRNHFEKRSHTIIQSDVFSKVSDTYDYIFANPPYLSAKRMGYVESSVLEWEPQKALFADGNGLFYIKKVLNEAPEYLAPLGTLFIEFDSWQKKNIENYTRQLKAKYRHVEFWRDQYKKWRVLKAVK